MIDATVTLQDKYTRSEGRAFMSGIHALVRLPLLQKARDEAAGLDTAGYISGYRGSPLGGYDSALMSSRELLKQHRIVFQPGLNEDLAATAIWGTQQTGLFGDGTVDGVFSIWYGKGPGVSRSMDAMKHANFAGCATHGGVLAVFGDDHGCQSSTLPHQSDQELAAAMVPVLCPTGPQEILSFGLFGFALSRFASCWVGLKVVVDAVESAASVRLDAAAFDIRIPEDFTPPAGGLAIRWPDSGVEQERRLHGPKLAAMQAFARANKIDKVVFDSPHARFGIAAVGKAYLDTREALRSLGLTESACEELGIRLYKVGLAWPLEPRGARDFTQGLEEILVVEEKRAFIEEQLARLLMASDGARPRLIGKYDERGEPLLPSHGELNPSLLARAVYARLLKMGIATPRAPVRPLESMLSAFGPREVRKPFYCSGCPHNTSTRVPEGSRAIGGIGCHGMSTVPWMPRTRSAQTITHMGGEGLTWVGLAPFSRTNHVFQNLGDGTYSHSGLLAIRAAAAAGVNITYKILFNDAVAMTGGQAVEGQLSVAQITHQVRAEGARRVVVVAEQPDRHLAADLSPGTQVRPRSQLEVVQRELRTIEGLTVLIYDQTCAAEKRRRRKRKLLPDPAKRLFIHQDVCEGCGDCSAASNCISVRPVQTELGRKRAIDQSNCNKDFSCQDGFCPSFVTVHGGSIRARASESVDLVEAGLRSLPTIDVRPLTGTYSVLVTGIGGTGVITVGQILGMAAHLEGKGCSVLDFTGLAQKNGAVMSHVRLAAAQEDIHAARIGEAAADLIIACDAIVAASDAALQAVKSGVTRAVVNGDITPVADIVGDGDMNLDYVGVRSALEHSLGRQAVQWIAASDAAKWLLGDSIAANILLLGYVWQQGWLPLGIEAIERAIELNGTSVTTNKRAFALGRLFAHSPALWQQLAPAVADDGQVKAPRTLDDLIERRAAFLAEYQDAAYANTYREFVAQVRSAERGKVTGSEKLTTAVAESLFKLMSYSTLR